MVKFGTPKTPEKKFGAGHHRVGFIINYCFLLCGFQEQVFFSVFSFLEGKTPRSTCEKAPFRVASQKNFIFLDQYLPLKRRHTRCVFFHRQTQAGIDCAERLQRTNTSSLQRPPRIVTATGRPAGACRRSSRQAAQNRRCRMPIQRPTLVLHS